MKKKINIQKFKELFSEKYSLYATLADLVKEEKKSIEEMEIDALWKFMSKKQNIIEHIADKRKEILDFLNDSGVVLNITLDDFDIVNIVNIVEMETKQDLQMIIRDSVRIREKVHSRAKANKRFVDEFLTVTNNLLNIFTGKTTKPKTIYDRAKNLKENFSVNMLVSREA